MGSVVTCKRHHIKFLSINNFVRVLLTIFSIKKSGRQTFKKYYEGFPKSFSTYLSKFLVTSQRCLGTCVENHGLVQVETKEPIVRDKVSHCGCSSVTPALSVTCRTRAALSQHAGPRAAGGGRGRAARAPRAAAARQ